MREMSTKNALKVGENVAAHVVAIIVGFALMLAGLGMGVTMVLIFVAIPVGLVGLGIFLWGIWGFGEARRRRSAETG